MIGRIGRKGSRHILVFSREDSRRLMPFANRQAIIIIDCMIIIRRISIDKHYKPPRLIITLPSSLRLVWERLDTVEFDIIIE